MYNKSNYQDIELVCVCGAPFTWTAGEQEFMADLHAKGKVPEIIQPKRCKPCRLKKKREREEREQRGNDY